MKRKLSNEESLNFQENKILQKKMRGYAIKSFDKSRLGKRDLTKIKNKIKQMKELPEYEYLLPILKIEENDSKISLHMQLMFSDLFNFYHSHNYFFQKKENLYSVTNTIALAIQLLHDNNFIHGDIKLENVVSLKKIFFLLK